MKKPLKMNILYKIGFILMFVCLGLFAASVVVMLVFDRHVPGVLIAVAGALLCLIAIILTMFSKPKKPKAKRIVAEESENLSAEYTELTIEKTEQ